MFDLYFSQYMVPMGPWKREKSLNLKKIVTGLEKSLIFVKTLINREMSLILINLWCFAELILKNVTQRRQLTLGIKWKKKLHLNKDVV